MTDIGHKLMQRFTDTEDGDCFRACVASMLGLVLEDVPNFCATSIAENAESGHWYQWFRKWLAWYNFGCLMVGTGDDGTSILEHITTGSVVLAGGKSPRHPGSHEVILRVDETNGFKYWVNIWDPHPDATFLSGNPHDVIVIYPLRAFHVFPKPDAATIQAAITNALPSSLKHV